MPPPRPQIVFPWRCPSCRQNLPSSVSAHLGSSDLIRIQPFSFAPRLFNTPPPESPSFIDVPKSAQPTYTPSPRSKGFIPKPRNIFNKQHRGNPENITPEYLNAQTPEAAKPLESVSPSDAAQSQWRMQQSAKRRQNLREGLSELASRRIKLQKITTARSLRRTEERERLVTAEQREDERLTGTTVTSAMQTPSPTHGVLPDPDGPARRAAAMERVRALQQRKEERTQDALHTLYMQARKFITSESQLDNVIQDEFGDVNKPRTWKPHGDSFWSDRSLHPPSIKTMLENAERQRGGKDTNAGAGVMKDRLRRVAEELTGGRI